MIDFAHRVAMIQSFPKGSIGAEIGVRKGEFSRVILDTVKPSLLYLVDCWQQQDVPYDVGVDEHAQCKKSALERVAPEIARGVVKVLAMFSHEAVQHVPDESMDWVYIDAGHMYQECLADLRLWYPKVKHGGRITGHDYAENVPYLGVCKAVGEFMEDHGLTDLKLTSGLHERAPSFYMEKA